MKKLIIALLFIPFAIQAQLFEDSDIFIPEETLCLKLPDSNRRSLFPKDPVLLKIVQNNWSEPKAGQIQSVTDNDTLQWKRVRSDEDGWFQDKDLRGGYAYFKINLKKEQVVLLEGLLHDMVFVNGVPRIGNRYQWKEEFESWEPRSDYSLMPVKLEKGTNHLLFKCSRGGIKIKIHSLKDEVFFNVNDRTFPDFLIGENINHWASTIVVNGSARMLEGAVINGTSQNGLSVETKIPPLLPFSVRKVKFHIKGNALSTKEEFNLALNVLDKNGQIRAHTDFPLRVTNNAETYRRTFISSIDGSVQYYAVNEALIKDNTPKALYLSLHGANVEAWNQANAYYPKHTGHIIAPTNRRPFGYNWEDWGRLDALEVLHLAKKNYQIDSDRVYLTGHSMGGHGTWIVGATYPGSFAAIGPSAGWISFWTYRFKEEMDLDSEAAKLLMRSANQHNTFVLAENFDNQGIYILHGKDDDNVRVDQAYLMIDRLKQLNKQYLFHEEPDAGHWWDKDDAPGAQCVDWAPMFDLFNSKRIAANNESRQIKFTTFNPGVSAWNKWAAIYSQEKALEKSVIQAQFDAGLNRINCTTKNVSRLAIDVSWITDADSLIFALDSRDTISISNRADTCYFELTDNHWQKIEKPATSEKGPHRNGTFKDAFRNNVLFVVGTKGSQVENKWALDKARYDAEIFWYQGNGSIDIIFDHQFNQDDEPDRSVILYGNANTNSAWGKLLDKSPIQVNSIGIKIGENKITGSDLAAFFIRPRPGSKIASVGVVAGSGIDGMRLTNSQPYLYAGHGYPDFMIIDGNILTKEEKGLRAAGFFENNWSLKSTKILFQ